MRKANYLGHILRIEGDEISYNNVTCGECSKEKGRRGIQQEILFVIV
jgi:hypothetical protein